MSGKRNAPSISLSCSRISMVVCPGFLDEDLLQGIPAERLQALINPTSHRHHPFYFPFSNPQTALPHLSTNECGVFKISDFCCLECVSRAHAKVFAKTHN